MIITIYYNIFQKYKKKIFSRDRIFKNMERNWLKTQHTKSFLIFPRNLEAIKARCEMNARKINNNGFFISAYFAHIFILFFFLNQKIIFSLIFYFLH